MKLFERIQLVKLQSGQSRSGQAGSESCLPSGDRRERSVDSENVGREDSAPYPLTCFCDGAMKIQSADTANKLQMRDND